MSRSANVIVLDGAFISVHSILARTAVHLGSERAEIHGQLVDVQKWGPGCSGAPINRPWADQDRAKAFHRQRRWDQLTNYEPVIELWSHGLCKLGRGELK